MDTAEPALPTPADLRLVAVDMDGTLLNEHGRIPDALWPLLERMRARGIVLAPASGRQYATLRRDFGSAGDGLVFIAENGAFVARDDEEISSHRLSTETVQHALTTLRALAADGHDIGVVLCGKRSAYIERDDDAFRAEAARYYAELAVVPDLSRVDDDVVKIAVYDFEDAEASAAPALAPLRATHQVVVSGEHWVDVMSDEVDKGHALQRLQRSLGVTKEQTAAFGDYLNDVGMLRAAAYSFAMADAHPQVADVARFRAPSHRDEGVITVLRRLLGEEDVPRGSGA